MVDMDLCGCGSTLALLNPLSPESNACSDIQNTGIEVGGCVRAGINTTFGILGIAVHVTYALYGQRVSMESWNEVCKETFEEYDIYSDNPCVSCKDL